jgi:hypothetical protein
MNIHERKAFTLQFSQYIKVLLLFLKSFPFAIEAYYLSHTKFADKWDLPMQPVNAWVDGNFGLTNDGGPNCYSFAVSDSSEHYNPGVFSRRYRNDPRTSPIPRARVDHWVARLEADGLVRVTRPSQLTGNEYPVLLFATFARGRVYGYHFVRPDRAGGWWQKRGRLAPSRVPFHPVFVRGHCLIGVFMVDLVRLRDTGYIEITPWAAKVLEKAANA